MSGIGPLSPNTIGETAQQGACGNRRARCRTTPPRDNGHAGGSSEDERFSRRYKFALVSVVDRAAWASACRWSGTGRLRRIEQLLQPWLSGVSGFEWNHRLRRKPFHAATQHPHHGRQRWQPASSRIPRNRPKRSLLQRPDRRPFHDCQTGTWARR